MSVKNKYAFLGIYHESEGVARGAHLVEKINRAVYNAIQAHSSPDHARNNNLFHIETEVPDVVNLDRKNRSHILERLIRDRVVAQIFRLDYDQEQNVLIVVPCFITHTSEESDELLAIYQATVQRSVQAVELLLNKIPIHSKEAILMDLNKDFESKEVPSPSDLPATIVEPFKHIHASKFDVLPSPEMMQQTEEDIRSELIRQGKLLDVLNYGLMYFRESEAPVRVEAASKVLHESLLPKYQSIEGLKRQLDGIAIDEASYKIDEHAPPTSRFDLRRAEALKQSILADPNRRGEGTRFAGSLAVETLLLLAEKTENQLQKKHRLKSLAQYENFKKSFEESVENWQKAMLVLTEEDRLAMPIESWRNLVDDLELYYRKWEHPTGTQHIFIRREPEAFRILIQNMGMLSSSRHWEILAMKTILEENEAEMPDLFNDPQLVTAYGKLLRSVYMNYIPWWWRLLMAFGFRFAQDAGFRIAKGAIELEQERLHEENRALTEEAERRREQEKREAREKLKKEGAANEIKEQLDWFYFERGLVPSVGEVRTTLQNMDLRVYENLLTELGFQRLKVPDKSSEHERVLLYPVDKDWYSRVGKLRRVADKILQEPGLATANPLQFARAKVLRKFLESAKSTAAETQESDENLDDPYERFEEEVEKVKKEEARLAESEDTIEDIDAENMPEI